MKKKFTFLTAAIVLLAMIMQPGKALSQTYSITSFTGTGTYSTSGGEQTISGVTWAYAASTYIGIMSGELQIGKSNSAQTSAWTFQTPVSSFGSNKKVTSVYASLRCGETTATYSISVGGSTIASGSLTTSSTSYGANNLNVTSGDIIITMQAGSGNKKAIYINSITITYENASTPTTYTVTYYSNGATSGSVPAAASYAAGTDVTVAGPGNLAKTGCTFSGWNTEDDGSGYSYAAGGTIMAIGEDIDLYAQWTSDVDVSTYTIITSTAQIIPGAHYVIVGSNATGTIVYKAMGSQNDKYRNVIDVATIKSKDTDDDGEDDTYYIEQSGLYEFVISGYTNNYTIYDETNATSGYLYHAGDKNVNVRASIGNDNAAKWKISYENGFFKLNNASATSYYLQYNSQSPRFTEYTGTQRNCYLFIKDDDNNCHIYSATNITSDMTVTGNMNIHAGVVTVKALSKLTVEGTLTNSTAANLVIEDGSQLYTETAGVNATVENDIFAADNWGTASTGWQFIASPLTSNYTPTGAMVNDNYDLYRLSDTDWENWKKSGDHYHFNIEPGRGYLYAKSANITLSFAGAIKPYSEENNANQKALSAGWNLIGNPYTFDIYIDKPYYKMNSAGTDVELVENYWEAANFIPAGTGVVVYAESAGTVTFSKTAPSAPTPAAGNHGSVQMTLIKDNMRGNAVQDKAVVSFNEQMQLGKFVFNENNSKLYIPKNGEEYAIAFSDRQGDMDLNFKASELGTYTISFEGVDMDLNGVYLIDILEQKEIDLSVNPSYTFMGSPADREARFKIVFRTTGFENSPSDIFAYQNGNEIVVSGEGELQVFDVTGRKVMTATINGVQTVNGLANGVYIFRMNEKVQKIVVR